MNSAVLFQIQSALILTLIYFGVYIRKNRSLHIKVMASAILWDILLILQIELTRGAVEKASKMLINPIILNIHVALALSTVILYGFMIYHGKKIATGIAKSRPIHKNMGMAVVSARTLTLITSFFVATH